MPISATTDLSDRFGDEARVLPPELRNFGGRISFQGSAVTVKCFEDNSRVKEILTMPGSGKVLVVDGGASKRCALLGDMIARDAEQNGWEGIVIYGCVRDSAILTTLGIAIKALGVTPRKSTRCGEGMAHLTVDIGGVSVNDGDFVVGDADGVVILTPAQANEVTKGAS